MSQSYDVGEVFVLGRSIEGGRAFLQILHEILDEIGQIVIVGKITVDGSRF
jgi:hypothetical protein